MRTYVLFHALCADGFGAAMAAWLKFGDQAEYVPVKYGEPCPLLDSAFRGIVGADVYIADFSYPADVLLSIGELAGSVTALDHHASAQKDLAPEKFLALVGNPPLIADENAGKDGFMRIRNVAVKFDMTKSGAVLAWEYFHPNTPAPEFFLYLQDRDLWQWKLPFSREVSAALRSYSMDFGTWASISGIPQTFLGHSVQTKTPPEAIEKLAHSGMDILRFQNQQVEMQVRAAKKVLIIPHKPDSTLPSLIYPYIVESGEAPPDGCYLVPSVNCTCFISEVCEKLLELYPTAPFVAAYRDTKDGTREWSLRSRGDFDVSEVAKAFIHNGRPGGGHKAASGMTTSL